MNNKIIILMVNLSLFYFPKVDAQNVSLNPPYLLTEKEFKCSATLMGFDGEIKDDSDPILVKVMVDRVASNKIAGKFHRSNRQWRINIQGFSVSKGTHQYSLAADITDSSGNFLGGSLRKYMGGLSFILSSLPSYFTLMGHTYDDSRTQLMGNPDFTISCRSIDINL